MVKTTGRGTSSAIEVFDFSGATVKTRDAKTVLVDVDVISEPRRDN